MISILVVVDGVTVLKMLERHLQRTGYDATCCSTLAQGEQAGKCKAYDLIMLDVDMPDGNGIDAIPCFLDMPSQPEIIIITGNSALDSAERAIREGAWCYIEKPLLRHDIDQHLTLALQFREEKKNIKKIPVTLQRQDIIGNSAPLNKCLDLVAQSATTDAAVLISGETGTGKELFAEAIHKNSNRDQQNFVVVDCATLPANLFESILFGYIKGAFTGADATRDGLIAAANGGTLFLDEVGELPLKTQKKFLRVLQEHKYRRIGETVEQGSDFRIVAATNRDLEQMVKDGSFRSDLFYRLRTFAIEIPPLRSRMEDIRVLTRTFLGNICDRRLQVNCKSLSSEFLACLDLYSWPGNVRELRQVIEQAFAASHQFSTLHACHLPDKFRLLGIRTRLSDETCKTFQNSFSLWSEHKTQCEQQYLTSLVQLSRGSIKKACTYSGISKTRLYELLKKHNLQLNANKESTPRGGGIEFTLKRR